MAICKNCSSTYQPTPLLDEFCKTICEQQYEAMRDSRVLRPALDDYRGPVNRRSNMLPQETEDY